VALRFSDHDKESDLSILELPRNTALPRRLDALTEREIEDKLRRYERAMSAWQNKANVLRRAMTALQAASDDLVRVANVSGPEARGLDPDQAEQRGLLMQSIQAMDRHLARFD
jgi:adenylosuccinate lyase